VPIAAASPGPAAVRRDRVPGGISSASAEPPWTGGEVCHKGFGKALTASPRKRAGPSAGRTLSSHGDAVVTGDSVRCAKEAKLGEVLIVVASIRCRRPDG